MSDQRHQDENASLESAWAEVCSRLHISQCVSGVVTRSEPFGVFVDIGERFLAFVQVPEIKDGMIRFPEDYPSVGQKVRGRVIHLQHKSRQIQLTLRNSVRFLE